MITGIFNTYSHVENRVTAALLAVLRSLALSRTERLLRTLLEDDAFSLVQFRDQFVGGKGSVPDAAIIASAKVLIETKIVRSELPEDQLRRHLKLLDVNQADSKHLLVLTPDSTEPPLISALADQRVVWASFADVHQSIDTMLADPHELASERETFLLREFQALLESEGLLAPEEDTLVVAARHAWPEYERAHAYLCQEERSFRPVQRIAFYSGNKIHPRIPRILEAKGKVRFEPAEYDGATRDAIARLLDMRSTLRGQVFQLFLLSAPDDKDTISLSAPIENDLVSASGRRVAFTQGQRYVQSDRLRTATRTSELR